MLPAAEVGLDPLHHSLWWNVSQNVGRTDVINRPGITSCITPGGENFGPHRGRCILGYEKLLLSGIPADKLLLGTETEVQLSDLAGNAMAMPVVSAAILAALCIPAYARALEADDEFSLETMTQPSADGSSSAIAAGKKKKSGAGGNDYEGASSPASKASKAGKAGKAGKAAAPVSEGGFDEHLLALLPLCAEAEATSILCTCETSGGVSASGIVRCTDCLLSSCQSCGTQKALEWHTLVPGKYPCCGTVTEGGSRRSEKLPAEFEQVLRKHAPTAIALDASSAAQLAGLGVELPAEGARDFRLTRVVRERGSWMLGYSVCDPTVGTPLAELRITVGRLGDGRGLCALLFSFAPAVMRGERGRMPPMMRSLIADDTPRAAKAAPPQVHWELLRDAQPCSLQLQALSLVPSYRSEVGLVKYEHETWPDELHVSAAAGGAGTSAGTGAAADCAGVYERQRCRYSCVFGALWKRKAAAGKPTLWLLVRPTADRTAPDELVISSSPMHRDCDSHVVLELLPAGPRAAAAAQKQKGADETERATFKLLCELGKAAGDGKAPAAKKAKKGGAAAAQGAAEATARGAERLVAARAKVWQRATIRFDVPRDTTELGATSYGVELSNLPASTAEKLIQAASVTQLGGGGVVVGSGVGGGAGDGVAASGNGKRGGAAASSKQAASPRAAPTDNHEPGWHELRVLTASSTIAERRLAEAVAAPLLRFAARGGLDGMSKRWQELAPAKGGPVWGSCAKSAPPRPPEVWTRDGQRTYDVQASNDFERALRARPSAWDVRIHADGRLKIAARPHVAAHRAAEALRRGRGISASDLQIEWRVETQRSTLAATALTSFAIPSSAGWAAASGSLPFFRPGKALFPRQARALTWMLEVDRGNVTFDEVEYSDHTLSSGVGWALNVKATRTHPLRGGVMADAVGAGKTVNAIALIASTAREARAARTKADKHDLTHSGATLVVAPIHAVKPVWRQLLNEFTADLKCEIVESVADLKALSVARLRSADVVVVACELLCNMLGEGKKSAFAYQEHLAKQAKTAEAFPSFLSERKQSRLVGNEPDILTGVWVPNTSQDPFGKSAARQEDRDVAALFTVRYNEALEKLRARKFGEGDKGVPIEWFTWERLIIDVSVPACARVSPASLPPAPPCDPVILPALRTARVDSRRRERTPSHSWWPALLSFCRNATSRWCSGKRTRRGRRPTRATPSTRRPRTRRCASAPSASCWASASPTRRSGRCVCAGARGGSQAPRFSPARLGSPSLLRCAPGRTSRAQRRTGG